MFIPAGLTEAQVLETFEEIVTVLASRFVFPGFPVDDIAQEVRIFAMEALPRYDPKPDANGQPTRLLANFLYAHTKRRLLNLKRNLHHRTDPPCRECNQAYPHEPTPACRVYEKWLARNRRKANLNQSRLYSDDAEPRTTPDATDDIETNELLAKIDQQLPVELRSAYLRLRAGDKYITKKHRTEVEAAVRGILGVDCE
jgi:DNA-directed RNA polymerase specialized sigma24 family protein